MSGTSAPRHELGAQRQAGERVEHHSAGLAALLGAVAAARGELGVVGEGGADPDDDGIGLRPPAVGPLAALLAADPLGVARPRGHLPVERHGRLEEHPRPVGAGVLAEGLVEHARAGGDVAVGHHHLDALVAQDPQAPPGGLRRRVVGGDDHAADPGAEDGIGARRRLALVAAGLEETYSVAPLRSRPSAARMACTSACSPPYSWCQPSPSTSRSRATSAPTLGLGLTRPAPR